jgi:hypothetical protein
MVLVKVLLGDTYWIATHGDEYDDSLNATANMYMAHDHNYGQDIAISVYDDPKLHFVLIMEIKANSEAVEAGPDSAYNIERIVRCTTKMGKKEVLTLTPHDRRQRRLEMTVDLFDDPMELKRMGVGAGLWKGIIRFKEL